jgi:hypothetical protein
MPTDTSFISKGTKRGAQLKFLIPSLPALRETPVAISRAHPISILICDSIPVLLSGTLLANYFVPFMLYGADAVKTKIPRTANTSEQVIQMKPASGGSNQSRTQPNKVNAIINVPGPYSTIQGAIDGVTGGDVFGGEGQGFYGQQKADGRLRIDAALLGSGLAVQHSGDIATVHFHALIAGDPKIAINDVIVRGMTNGAQQVHSVLYDFMTSLSKYHGADAKELAAGVYGMFGGDVDATGDVAALDRSLTWNNRNKFSNVP